MDRPPSLAIVSPPREPHSCLYQNQYPIRAPRFLRETPPRRQNEPVELAGETLWVSNQARCRRAWPDVAVCRFPNPQCAIAPRGGAEHVARVIARGRAIRRTRMVSRDNRLRRVRVL